MSRLSIALLLLCSAPAIAQTMQMQPPSDYGQIMNSAARARAEQDKAQAAQDQARAAQVAAQAQLMQARAQARLAEQQAALVRQQREALERQQAEASAHAQQTPNASTLEATRAQIGAGLAADSVDGLKAKAATLEAVLRNSPPDSDSFRNATDALLTVNTELAKRGALKP